MKSYILMKSRRKSNDITSIIDFYDSSAGYSDSSAAYHEIPDESRENSTYSRIFQNKRSGSNNLNKITRANTCSKSFKYNTWEITGEHDGIFEKKEISYVPATAPTNGLSYFSSRKVKIQEEPTVIPAEKPNMFKEAIKRNSDVITNVNKQGEEMRFKRYEQYISMEVRGVKKIYDIFEIFNCAKTVNLEKPKQSAFQKMTSLFKSKK